MTAARQQPAVLPAAAASWPPVPPALLPFLLGGGGERREPIRLQPQTWEEEEVRVKHRGQGGSRDGCHRGPTASPHL